MKIIDCSAEQIESVITLVCKESDCRFIRIYDDQISLVLNHLSSLFFIVDI